MALHKAVVFLDIDGTLLDSRRNSSNHKDLPKVRRAIARLEREGVVFGLNSNRSIRDLLPIYRMAGLNGPAIAENGLFAKLGNRRTFVNLMSYHELEVIKATKKAIEKEMKAFLSGRYGDGFLWIDADTVKALGQRGRGFREGSLVALNNKFRKFTVSMHLKKVIGGELRDATRESRLLVRHLNSRFGRKDGFTILLSPFGNLIAFSAKVSKRSATKQVMEKIYPGYDCYGIGDEVGDYRMVEGFGRFIAVGNADAEVKKLAYFSAKRSYSAGVVDALRLIAADRSRHRQAEL